MIEVERMSGQKLWINPDFIKFMESTPDTVLTMKDNEKLLLRTSVDEIRRMMNTVRSGGT